MRLVVARVKPLPLAGVLAPLFSLAVAIAPCGCGGAPEIVAPREPDPGASPPPAAEGLLASSAHKEPLYNLASGESAGAGSEWEARALEPETDGAPAAPDRQLSRSTEKELTDELHVRWARQWSELSGGLGTSPDPVELGRLEEAAGKLAVAVFIEEGHGAGDAAVDQALAFLAQDGRRRDLGLLAAAAHEHRGEAAAVTRILGGLGYCPTPLSSDASLEDGGAAPFQVVGLTFAAAIEGPGKFVPLDPAEVRPGKTVLIYGELRNFTSVRESTEDAPRPLYRREFQAVLRLLSSEEKELDRLEFLPQKRGRQTASTLTEVMNFWARYRLPADLKPGHYKLIVDAEDILGGGVAAAELPVEIGPQ